MENKKFELEKFMYDKTYDELNRSRDWPLKVMAVASALFITLIGILKIDNKPIQLDCETKWTISIVLLIFTGLTWVVIIRQHLNYLRYRNIQIALQKEWKINELKGIPKKWTDELSVSIFKGFWGWFFYAFYILAIAAITGYLILH